MISELVDDSVAPPAPRPRTWVAPLMSSVVTLPAALVAYVIAAAVRFEVSAEWAFTVFGWGMTVALLTLATAWLLPWEERFVARRRGFSVAAPFAVVATFVLYLALVDWP
ncbi:hypothetical protein ACFYWS_32685 [Streptomyces sp. NPDC002795]|uniref:hypothetical protein n=1 Tax=Streptomyces sp. NPDC002795 TaxID=3364665 RepID=UPI0036B0D0E1